MHRALAPLGCIFGCEIDEAYNKGNTDWMTTDQLFFSACLGWATQIIPRKFTYYVSTALFALFGVKMLMEGWKMSPNEAHEVQEEAQAEVMKKENELNKEMESDHLGDVEAGMGGAVYDAQRRYRVIFRFVSKIFIEAFMLTFVAEWGDRSQLTTIILAAREVRSFIQSINHTFVLSPSSERRRCVRGRHPRSRHLYGNRCDGRSTRCSTDIR